MDVVINKHDLVLKAQYAEELLIALHKPASQCVHILGKDEIHIADYHANRL
jgi:hypothetical protein